MVSINDKDLYDAEKYPLMFSKRSNNTKKVFAAVLFAIFVICIVIGVVLTMMAISKHEVPIAVLVLDVGASSGDGSFWEPKKQVLFWVDGMKAYVFNPATKENREIALDQHVAAVIPRKQFDDGAVVAMGHVLGFLNLTTGAYHKVVEINDTARTRFSNAKCDPSGRLWAGTMNVLTDAPVGSLYRMGPDLRVITMLHNITISDGIVWSIDRTQMYHIDAAEQRVNLYDYNDTTGEISNQRVAFDIPEEYGVPNGMTIDEQGSLWIAMYGGGKVIRFTGQGVVQSMIYVPVSDVTSCAFGGLNLDELYITTHARLGESHSGGLYKANHLGVRGAPPFEFAG